MENRKYRCSEGLVLIGGRQVSHFDGDLMYYIIVIY